MADLSGKLTLSNDSVALRLVEIQAGLPMSVASSGPSVYLLATFPISSKIDETQAVSTRHGPDCSHVLFNSEVAPHRDTHRLFKIDSCRDIVAYLI